MSMLKVNRWQILANVVLLACMTGNGLEGATFTVANTHDNGDGSLRKAIHDSNATVGPDMIAFNIPGTPPFVIRPKTDLPHITDTVTIDGYTQPGSSVNTLEQGDNAVLTIVINGSHYTVGDGISTGNGLHFAPRADTSVDNSIVRGLVVNEWIDNGILLDTAHAPITGVKIIGNFIGTDSTGTQEMANRAGVGLSGPSSIVVGTSAPADRNIIAGSFGWFQTDDHFLEGACISAFGTNIAIKNNYIGLDATGTRILGNSQVGILFDISSGLLGGDPQEMNVVSGHSVGAIISFFSSNNTVKNNYVGTDVTGAHVLNNGNAGITFYGRSNNTITYNLVSGHQVGIRIGDIDYGGAILSTVRDNLVGTDGHGAKALSNARFGIEINDHQNTITDNLISGNVLGGLLIYGQAANNTATRNLVGTDRTGKKQLPNQGNGIQIGLNGGLGGALSNSIGE